MITARQFTAAEAKEMGLVHKVMKTEDLERRRQRLLRHISATRRSPCERRSGSSARSCRATTTRTKCQAWVKECFDSADYKEGRKAFMEKRKPVFTGR